MSVKIRLKQTGKRNAKSYRIVAVDESKKRDGRVIEELGAVSVKGVVINLKQERLDHWLKVGATKTAGATKILTK